MRYVNVTAWKRTRILYLNYLCQGQNSPPHIRILTDEGFLTWKKKPAGSGSDQRLIQSNSASFLDRQQLLKHKQDVKVVSFLNVFLSIYTVLQSFANKHIFLPPKRKKYGVKGWAWNVLWLCFWYLKIYCLCMWMLCFSCHGCWDIPSLSNSARRSIRSAAAIMSSPVRRHICPAVE